MEREVIGYGFASAADPSRYPELAAKAVAARARIRERVKREKLEACVEFFDREAYFSNMSIAENILFGTPRASGFPARDAGEQSGDARLAARRRTARRSLRRRCQSRGADGRAVRRRRARQRPVRAIQLHQPGRPARIPGAGIEVQQGQACGRSRTRTRRGCSRSRSGSSSRGIASGVMDEACRAASSPHATSSAAATQAATTSANSSIPIASARRFRSRTTSCSVASLSSRRARRRGSARSCATSRRRRE